MRHRRRAAAAATTTGREAATPATTTTGREAATPATAPAAAVVRSIGAARENEGQRCCDYEMLIHVTSLAIKVVAPPCATVGSAMRSSLARF